jgi:hypothetical protein
METELVVLANAAAAALVGLMVADSWKEAKQKVTGLFERGSAADGAAQELEAAWTRLAATRPGSDVVLRSAIEADWASRFWRLLQSEPGAAEVLQGLRDLPRSAAQARTAIVSNVNYGNVQFGSVIQAGQITGSTLPVIPPKPD